MANQTTVKAQDIKSQISSNTEAKTLLVGDLINATHTADGLITVKEVLATLKLVDVADVDLLLTFANGDHVVIANGALDALSTNPPDAIFNDRKINLSELFKLVGVANPAKSGSLRLVSENIDANPPREEIATDSDKSVDAAPPAPIVKVGIGTSSGPGKGPGNGNGDGEGEVPATVVPLTTAQPSVYRIGKSTVSPFDGTAIGTPNVTTALYTSSEFKVSPSGRSDSPLGSYVAGASQSELADRASAPKQATVEIINGTAGNDTIDFNSAFSTGVGQWSKTLHVTVNNFSDISSIQLTFDALKIAQIAGFDLKGVGAGVVVTRDSPTSNSWHIVPTTDMLLNGIDIAIVYNVNDTPNSILAPVDFKSDVTINGHAGPVPVEVINNLNLTWRDAVTASEFEGKNDPTDTTRMVLPRAGVGVEVFAGTGDDVVNTGAGPDLIHGGAGNDTINAGTGNDILDGGTGADALDGGTGVDVATYENASAFVVASLTNSLINVGDANGDTYNNIENLTGSAYNDTLIGDGTVNTLSGGDGNDILEGMAGSDVLVGGAGVNTASYQDAGVAVTASLDNAAVNTGDAAGDTYTQIQNLTGSNFNDTLIGDANVNTLNGGAGDDVLEGLAGADVLIGGSGNNTASYSQAGVGVLASLANAGINTGDALGDTYTQIQNLTGSAFNNTLIGDSNVNILSGGNGNDILEGMGGADALNGGNGLDTASYVDASTFVSASLTTGLVGFSSAGDASGDTFNSIENLTGSNYNDNLIGDINSNTLSGGAGDDILEGMGGADALIGGTGVNSASYEHAAAAVIASLDNAAINTGDALGDTYVQIQNLVGSNFNDTLIGDANDNTINGGVGDDLLEGMAGNDTLNGGIGTDTATYLHASASVAASLTTGLFGFTSAGDAAGDVFNSIENLTGSIYNDTLIGDASNNALNGGAGDDILEGLGGADTLTGGTGNNTASYEHAAVGLTASLTNTALNSGDANGDTYSNIQNLTGSAFSDNLTGDGSSNILNGGAGDDVLEGMGNADILNGGAGNDTASYANSSTFVTASLTSGLAGFSSSGDAGGDVFNSIENLTGSNGNDVLIGDSFVAGGSSGVNTLKGGAGDDILEGLGGADTLDGGTGNNTASYEHSANQGAGIGITASLITPASNTADALGDTYINIQNLTGSAFNDTLTGDANNNILTGGAGNDTLSGGLGVDQLYGGDGNDNLTDEGTGAYILDGGVGNDIITLTNTDAITGTVTGGAGNDTFVWDYVTGGQRVDVNMQAGTVYYYLNGGNRTVFSSIENVTVTGTNQLYIYADNNDNVITGGSTINDWVDYRYAAAGVNANIDTVARTINGITVNAQSATGGSGNDTLIGIDNLYAGSQFDDVLIGNANNNWIRGYTGSDIIDGGTGVDTWYIDWNGNSVTASLLSSAQNAAMGIVMTGDAAGDTVLNMENIYSTYGDSLYGNAVANDLYGRGLLEGFLGADNIRAQGTTATASYANAGNSYLAGQGITSAAGLGVTATLTTTFSAGPAMFNSGDAAGDTYVGINNLTGSAFNDILIGNSLANTIDGGAGNDVLEGLAGADTFLGGAGIDTASYAHSTTGVIADLATPANNTNDAAGDIYSSIENLTGSNFNDTLRGDGNDNLLDGGLGNNTLDGGGGFDTVNYSTATGALNINLATGIVTGAGRTDTLVSVERVIGSTSADTITGTAGDDWIDGGEGADNINAAGGIDTISFNNATGGRTVVLNTSSSDGKILSNFENIYGSAFGDSLTGDANDNIIQGGLGNDTLNGALGVDTVSYLLSAAAVSVNISNTATLGVAANAAAGGEGIDTLSNFENITGSDFDDVLIGDGNANTINGGVGNDLIIGGAGADTLIGGSGTDTLSYENALAAISITLNGTGTAGDANGDVTSGFENLVGTAFNDVLTGDGGNNVVDGGAGNDTINAGAGIDTITYLTAAAAVTVNLSNVGINATGGAGSDTLTNFENIIGSNFADTLTGDGGANMIEGGLGNDIIDGGTGVDTVSYTSAASGVSVNISGAIVLGITGNTSSGGAGNDTLANMENINGSVFNDILIGNNQANIIDGGSGDDTLIGGAGADTLIGGLGSDTVSYVNATSGANVTLGGAALTATGDAAGDIFSGIENLTGTAFNDILYGDSGSNTLIGGLGNDDLRGYDGNDTIDATQGFDQIYGGNGDDTILVSALSIDAAQSRYRGEGNNSTAFGGGDTLKLSGLVGGAYSLTSLANVTDGMEMLDIRDGVNTSLNITSLDVRNFVDGGNGSNMWIKANTGDLLNVSTVAGETVQSFNVNSGVDYVVYDASNNQVAAIHWQTA